jgi:hypothetical protein
MNELIKHLPEEYFELKSDGTDLYYTVPDDMDVFLKHVQVFWPVRMWVRETLDDAELDFHYYSVLGVWASSGGTVKFTGKDFRNFY